MSEDFVLALGHTVSVRSESGRGPDPGLVDAVRASISMVISNG